MATLTLLDPHTQKPLKQWQFPNQSAIRIGRFQDNDVVLSQFREVSRHHLELRKIGDPSSRDGWQLISQGTNGTFVNGKLVSRGSLRDNDVIRLAQKGPLLKFQISSSPAVPQRKPDASHPPARTCTHAGNPPNRLFCIHCNQPLVKQEQFIRDYQILRILGRGGMGTTYLAWDKTGKIVGKPILLVLKEMNATMVQVAKARELFERESRILKSLNHPQIPKYYDFFVERDKKYLAMEFVQGTNLEQWIYQKGSVQPQQGIKWMIHTCNILNYLHLLNPPLIHRDVKPANLLLRHLDNRVVLLDFGAVKEIGTPQKTCIGVEGYSAPEQSQGKPCPQSDLYAIGTTLIFLLTGSSPIEYSHRQGAELQLDVSKVPNLKPNLRKVIEKACQINVRDRYQSARELAQALSACL